MLNKLNAFLESLIPNAAADSRPEHTLQLATAVLLIEVTRADADIAAEEQAGLMRILKQRFQLNDAEVAKLAELGHHTSSSANDLQQFTALLNRELGMPEKVQIMEYMWQIAYADRRISAHEEHLMSKIAGLLYIAHRDYINAKLRAKPQDVA